MRAALCAYRCGREDLARTYIDQAITVDYGIAEDIWFDRQIAPEFDAVRSTNMATYVREAFARKDAALKLNIPLKNELQAIYETDQQPRAQIDSLIQKYGNESAQMQQLWQHIHRTDSINLIRIESIIRQYGYPGKRLVGPNQSNTAWLIIQHSPLATQEKYLPLIRKAAEEGEMDKSNVALLVDRIRMYKGQKQLYGSQIAIDPSGKRHFHPIADEVNVNKRRADMDLGSIEDYARENDILYKPVGRKSKK
ncbi:hypothetical protein AWR27_16850 [Spirosoma montaniterrae]|uniref:Uncharacterized protein n=2 Tax=Spirosoma montaniterrae TaxID=1178516 RepID=A0A1P9WZP2_9BACT|nr:hypothetical protein AWR27_16850 [Spirosoma montaniterrae]